MTDKKKNAKVSKLVVRIVLLSFIGAFLGFQIYLLNAEKLVGDAMPMPFGIGTSVVLSGSMEPELSVDDLIIVKKHDTYNVGDVIVYQSNGTLIVHRIIEMNGEEIIAQGDANNTPDDPINLESIKGKVEFSVPFIGKIIRLIKTPIGIIIIIAAAILLMELSFKREKEKDSDDIEKIKEEIRRLKEQQFSKSDSDGGSDKSE